MVIKHIKKFFGIGPKEETPVAPVTPEAPYKVESTPVDNVVAVAVALDLEGAEATLAKKPRKPRAPRTPKAESAPVEKKTRKPRKPKASE
jgi:hypothetical protein